MRTRFFFVAFGIMFLGVSVSGAEPALPSVAKYEKVSKELAREKRCSSCHEGIEDINALMTASWGANTKCEVCHKGNPTANSKTEAHKGMIVHPGDFRVIDQTCGQCHDDSGLIRKDVEGLIPSVVRMSRVVSRGERNHVQRVFRNSMATAAGEVATTRYLWGAQETKEAAYSLRPVKALPEAGSSKPYTVENLQQLPAAENSTADSLLRNECLKCHLWTRGKENPGLYRGGGCDACHVLYADDGLSQSADPTAPKTAPGHPIKHEITVKIPSSQCLHCHNREGSYIGMGYCGMMYTQGGVPYQDDGTPQAPRYDAAFLQTWPDVHFAGGMDCIDCHTSRDVHGTGALFTSMNYEVAIDCESCHGNTTTAPTLKDRRNNLLPNIVVHGQELTLHGKVSGQTWPIVQVDKLMMRDALPVAMRIPAHLQEVVNEKGEKEKNRLECYSCHGTTASQYYGYEFRRDDRLMAPIDWVVGLGEGAGPVLSPGRWEKEFTYSRLENPVFGINHKGRVSPFIPHYQAFITLTAGNGETPVVNQVAKTAAGTNGLAFAALQPHTITRQALRCEYCHTNPKAQGLGEVGMSIWGQGWNLQNPLERIVDELGAPVQETVPLDTRPFTRAEMDRIDRMNVCLSCHQNMDNPEIWKQVTDLYGFAKTNQQHKGILERMFNRVLNKNVPK